MQKNINFLFLVAVVIFGAVIVAGLFYSGGPRQARAERVDNKLEQALQVMSETLDRKVEKAELPDTIDEISLHARHMLPFRDLGEGTYRKLSDTTYELCVTFRAESNVYRGEYSRVPLDEYVDFRDHSAGRQCYNGPFNK